MADEEWSIYVVDEVREWIYGLDETARDRVAQAIDVLAERGPRLGRPLVDTIQHSSIANLKELRPGDARLLFVFDPWRSAIFLVAGDKSGRWREWYVEAIPLAEERYQKYLSRRAEEEGQGAS
ncbi:type II toxin-antitoxin system RelE/ParE family toxin [Promicromonospora sp. NPDC060271]|uniref:type II toxin-antitoxin system RelE/ParE family toxin n=1 Tax=Promicromonospora sp. NPDC060271 TaxID=3347089 RepID=UPI003647B30E